MQDNTSIDIERYIKVQEAALLGNRNALLCEAEEKIYDRLRSEIEDTLRENPNAQFLIPKLQKAKYCSNE